jgi:hypothetical protein
MPAFSTRFAVRAAACFCFFEDDGIVLSVVVVVCACACQCCRCCCYCCCYW